MSDGHLTQSSIIAAAQVAPHAALTTGVHGAVGADRLAVLSDIPGSGANIGIIAMGQLDGTAGTPVWLGNHTGFSHTITDGGAGDWTVELTANPGATYHIILTVATAVPAGATLQLISENWNGIHILCHDTAGTAADAIINIIVVKGP